MTQKARVLALLRLAGSEGVLTADFLDHHIPRFSARVEELRAQGFEIETRRVGPGSWRYRLLAEVAAGLASPGGADGDLSAHDSAPPSVPTTPGGAGQLFEAEQFKSKPAGAYEDAA